MNKSELGKLGVFAMANALTTAEAVELAQKIESWGYGCWWVPDISGRDQFVVLGAMFQATTELKLATGITVIYTREPGAMHEAYYTLNEISGGRFILGLGASHKEVVEYILKKEYQKPLSAMRSYLAEFKSTPAQLLYLGELDRAPLEKDGMVILAALQDKMIQLGGEEADGVHPYLVSPDHTARAREILGPEPLLAPELHVVMIKDPSEARRVARQYADANLSLQNYRSYLKKYGYTDEDFEQGGSDRLIDDIVAWGDETAIMKRVEAHWKNGADHVAIMPLDPEFDPVRTPHIPTLEALAPA